MNNKKCFMCGEHSNGIIIKGKVICNKCERKIISVEIRCWTYNDYVNYIKDILYKI